MTRPQKLAEPPSTQRNPRREQCAVEARGGCCATLGPSRERRCTHMAEKLMRGSVQTILDAVGKTPIVRLNKLAQHVKADIYCKLEFLNPGGSMKDRIGIHIVNQAEAQG